MTTMKQWASMTDAEKEAKHAADREAWLAWEKTIAKPALPAGWHRTFEPEWSCGAYFLYWDKDPAKDPGAAPCIEVCVLGISTSYLDHESPPAIVAVVQSAADDWKHLRAHARDVGDCECDTLVAHLCPVHEETT